MTRLLIALVATCFFVATLLFSSLSCVPAPVRCDGEQQLEETRLDGPFDRDGDGYFDAADAGCVEFYGPQGLLDCDDGDERRNGGLDEILCNEIDDDCDDSTPDANDADGDGYPACTDCDESDPDIHPEQPELCDGIDNNCVDGVDEDQDGDGSTVCDDCDDSLATVYPQAYELCDGLDSDCDGDADHPGESLGSPTLCVDEPAFVRVAAANLSSGDDQHWEEPGIRIMQGLQPDVVLIQEFNYGNSSETDLREFVDRTFGESFSYARIDAPGITLPNGVISRWPIVGRGIWEDTTVSNRNFFWARIELPSGHDLWAVSLHWSASSSSERRTAAELLVDYIQQTVPEGDLLVIGGDLNTQSSGELSLSILEAVVSFDHIPVDEANNDSTNEPRNRPYDWVLPDADLDQFAVQTRVAGMIFPDGLVYDSRVFSQPVPPIDPQDSNAVNMQHMAVIKDYVVDWNP